MLKIALCVCIVGLSTYGAFIASKKYKRKKNFYYDFQLFNERLISEVSFTKTPLIAFCNNYTYQSDFNEIVQGFIQNSIKVDKHKFLKADEKKFIIDYFSMLGRSDSLSQKNYLMSNKNQIDNLKNASTDECVKYSGLYIKLGFLLGLLLVIIIY